MTWKSGSERGERLTRKRYEEAAERQTRHPDTRRKWPRRWLLFGPRVLPVATMLHALARLDHSLGKRVGRAQGELRAASLLIEKLKRHNQQTQDYIAALKSRLQEGADAGMTVADWIAQDRARARDYKVLKLRNHLARQSRDADAEDALRRWEGGHGV